jgi:uncharacterized protein YoaH (UPF0181 family)
MSELLNLHQPGLASPESEPQPATESAQHLIERAYSQGDNIPLVDKHLVESRESHVEIVPKEQPVEEKEEPSPRTVTEETVRLAEELKLPGEKVLKLKQEAERQAGKVLTPEELREKQEVESKIKARETIDTLLEQALLDPDTTVGISLHKDEAPWYVYKEFHNRTDGIDDVTVITDHYESQSGIYELQFVIKPIGSIEKGLTKGLNNPVDIPKEEYASRLSAPFAQHEQGEEATPAIETENRSDV